MYGVKVTFMAAAITSIIVALALIWLDTEFVFGVTASKVYASLFVLLAVTMTKEYCSIEIENDEQKVC